MNKNKKQYFPVFVLQMHVLNVGEEFSQEEIGIEEDSKLQKEKQEQENLGLVNVVELGYLGKCNETQFQKLKERKQDEKQNVSEFGGSKLCFQYTDR